MKREDLMIGDWVYNKHHKKYICITPYDFFTHGHLPSGRQYFIGEPEVISGRDLEPIPLTPEILEKNGFIKKEYRWILLDSYTKDKLIVLLNAANCFALLTTEGMTLAFQYVHELQHFYRLCGIHKEIEI